MTIMMPRMTDDDRESTLPLSISGYARAAWTNVQERLALQRELVEAQRLATDPDLAPGLHDTVLVVIEFARALLAHNAREGEQLGAVWEVETECGEW
ncbi:uncharacterized protein LOC62_01G000058 [Vanrija pseudolonga]|uniref:Uncharacterized protein n=1 Tax=Vanrija pseudolonga TaxID=143232 RepID=A0AAF1BEV4_9TREE|nr:hypothetical protein LOC62_01G000058 [Vanrija pseudolonga]